MFKITRELFDYFKWQDIERKYEMKYLNKYKAIEDSFVNDLIKHNIVSVYYNNEKYKSYYEIIDDIRLRPKDIVRIRSYFKKIYDFEIEDNSEYGKASELTLWE